MTNTILSILAILTGLTLLNKVCEWLEIPDDPTPPPTGVA